MAYKLTATEAKLPKAVAYLRDRDDLPGHCLEYCRAGLGRIGVSLPSADLLREKFGHSTALNCYHVLAADPGAYGLVRVTQPEVHPIMIEFFNNCGNENGLVCGHIALKDGDTLYSSKDYKDGDYWHQRLVGQFIPK